MQLGLDEIRYQYGFSEHEGRYNLRAGRNSPDLAKALSTYAKGLDKDLVIITSPIEPDPAEPVPKTVGAPGPPLFHTQHFHLTLVYCSYFNAKITSSYFSYLTVGSCKRIFNKPSLRFLNLRQLNAIINHNDP